jgi:hypothetical protein
MGIFSNAIFLNRLRLLQSLITPFQPKSTSYDHNIPEAILIIPGVDGRNNKEAIKLLKYLFEGATGDELFAGGSGSSLENDCLEETIFLIKEDSISVFWR